MKVGEVWAVKYPKEDRLRVVQVRSFTERTVRVQPCNSNMVPSYMSEELWIRPGKTNDPTLQLIEKLGEWTR